jgi:hypothetical protein
LYGDESSSLTSGNTHIERVESRVLRRIFGSEREEVTGGWRKLHNEELRNLYPSSNIRMTRSMRMKRAGCVARKGKLRNACKILLGKPEGKSDVYFFSIFIHLSLRNCTFRRLSLLPPSGQEPNQMGSLEEVNLKPNGSNRVGCSPEDRSTASFRNVMWLLKLRRRKMNKNIH